MPWLQLEYVCDVLFCFFLKAAEMEDLYGWREKEHIHFLGVDVTAVMPPY